MTVLLIGGSGYIGQAFARELKRCFINHVSLSRAGFDYTKFENLYLFLKEHRPKFVINCAGVAGVPNIDWCEDHKAETILGNVVLPATVANACAAFGTPFAHVSSGCVYDASNCPQPPGGFSEIDPPNFSFRNPPCSFYSGSKALGEEAIAFASKNSYVWRLRLPFNEIAHPKNLISKLMSYPRVYDSPSNSASHLDDAVRACVALWDIGAPYMTYNVTSPGVLNNRRIISMIRDILKPDREFKFWADDAEFYSEAARAPRSNCVLSSEKLEATGVKMRPVIEALTASLQNWKTAP